VSERRRIEVRLTAQVACAGCASKLGPADLRAALHGLPVPKRDPRVLVDHRTLDDAGVFAWGRGEALVQTADFFTPVVDDPYDYGQIAAANALSDVYAMGGKPLTSLALLCYPDGDLPPEVLREVLRGGQDKMVEAGVSILGGHSVRDRELKFGYSVTGVVQRKHLLKNAGARAGDRLLLTKPLGTGILTTALKQGQLDGPLLARVTKQMATLNRRASEVAVEFGARAATDVTGFSLMGHASQVADASGVSLRLHPITAWLLPRVLELAAAGAVPGGLLKNRDFFGPKVGGAVASEALELALYDPQTSGGLLIAAPPRKAAAMMGALRRSRVWVVEIGEATTRGARSIELV
jgi:selenide, water dikinase